MSTARPDLVLVHGWASPPAVFAPLEAALATRYRLLHAVMPGSGAGAREIHLRISAPPTTHPCYYGIDTPTRSELIASSHTREEIARYVTCDSLEYLSHAGMIEAVRDEPGAGGFCSACFTGQYPVPLGEPRPVPDVVPLPLARGPRRSHHDDIPDSRGRDGRGVEESNR